MPFGCSASLHRLSHFLQFTFPTFAQLLCPSPSFVHFFLRSLHYTTFVATFLLIRHDVLRQTHGAKNSMHMPFRKHTLQYSLGFIALTTSFIHFSRLQSTRCQLFCVPFVPAAASGLSWFLCPDHNVYPKNKNTRQTLAYYFAVYRPANAVLCSHHLAGARSFRPFVPHSRLSCAARTPRYSVDKFATRLSFFLAAGAITFFAIHLN